MDGTLASSEAGAAPNTRGAAQALALEIESAIVRGEYAPGDRLPPVRYLADERGLATNTVAAAYRRLANRGLVEGRGRAGTIVSLAPHPTGAAPPSVAEGVVDLAGGNPDPRLLPDWAPILASMAKAGWTHPLYGGEPILAPLRDRLTDELNADGVDVEALCLVSGALDGIERVLATNLRHGDAVAIEDPGYRPVRSLVAALGLRAVPLAVDSEGVRPEALVSALEAGVRAVVLTPRAQNPTGAALTPERAADLGDLVKGRDDVLVIEDDHAGPVAGSGFASAGRQAARRVVIRSAAKSYGPDLRLAVVAGDAVTIDRVSGRLAVGTGWVPHLLQSVALRLMTDSTVAKQLAEAGRSYARRRRRFGSRLVHAGVMAEGACPSTGFNLWVPVADEGAVAASMLSAGYAITPGASFRLDAPTAVRISVGHLDDEIIDAAADALIAAVSASGSARSA